MFWPGDQSAVVGCRATGARELGDRKTSGRRAATSTTARERAARHDRICPVCCLRLLPGQSALRRLGFHTRRQIILFLILSSQDAKVGEGVFFLGICRVYSPNSLIFPKNNILSFLWDTYLYYGRLGVTLLSLWKIWPIISHNSETVQDRR